MGPTNLSSNWKKLQETLKKSDSDPAQNSHSQSHSRSGGKRATPDSSAKQNGVKRRRTTSTSSSLASKTSAKGTGKGSGTKLFEHRHRKSRSSKKMSTAAASAEVSENVVIPNGESAEVKLRTKTSFTKPSDAEKGLGADKINEGLSPTAEVGKYVAIDCEMVGVGPNPDADSVLARISVVNFNGEQVYDSFVQPKEMVTDWRTHISGVSAKNMVDARSFEDVQRDVAGILDGRILIGHAVRNDLEALLLGHPRRDIRDTSKHAPYRKVAGGGSPALRILAAEFLGVKIQGAAHSSVEDARATMLLFRRDKETFDREHAKKWPVKQLPVNGEKSGDSSTKQNKKKKKKTKGR